MAVADLLGPDPLARLEHELALTRIEDRLGSFLPSEIALKNAMVLRPYVETRPWTYWDDTTLEEILRTLEVDPGRSIKALTLRSTPLNRGFRNLYRSAQNLQFEQHYRHGRARELLIIANHFLPEYLRLAEHVLGNLTQYVWSVVKKGGVEGKFVLKNAIASFKARGPTRLTSGYEDKVRNAIAHGEVEFKGLEIEFGSTHPLKLGSFDFLRLFDDLTRTCIGLGLATHLFWLRNQDRGADVQTPLALATRATAGAVGRDGLTLVGAIESTPPLAGRQLHVALRVDTRSRLQVMLETGRVARELLDQGALGFERFLFEVDSGERVSSLVIVRARLLETLLKTSAPEERLRDAFENVQLIWFDEPRFRTRIRAWLKILRSAWMSVKAQVVRQWHESGVFLSKGRYVIREFQNKSIQGIPRVEIRAVLRNPNDARQPDVVRSILRDLGRRGRRRLVRSRGEFLDPGLPWPKRPKHVFIQLYRRDGPARWLQRDGWMGGNIVAVGEGVWGGREPVLVKTPQEVR